jgi:hypothetical protein
MTDKKFSLSESEPVSKIFPLILRIYETNNL